MHPRFVDADRLSRDAIGAAIEVHRFLGPGLLESIYEKCMLKEFELRGIPVVTQEHVRIEYKGLIFKEELKFDPLINGALLVEIKAVQEVHPVHKAQLMSYMKLLNVPMGLLINFHQIKLVDGVSRMMMPGANQEWAEKWPVPTLPSFPSVQPIPSPSLQNSRLRIRLFQTKCDSEFAQLHSINI